MADNTIEIEVEIDGKKGFAKLKTDALFAGKESGEALGESFQASAQKSIAGVKSVIASIAAIATGVFVKSAIEAATQQEDAVNKLSIALANAGRLSDTAMTSFKGFADELQRTTKFADEQVLAFSSLATNYTKTNEQAQKLVQSSIDLSAATGIDVTSAIEILGRSLNGFNKGLQSSIPGFGKFTEEALRSGAALDFIQQRFGGSAVNEIKTFSGAVAVVKNAFGEVLESVGEVITKSPAAIETIKAIGKAFLQIAGFIRESFSGDTLRSFILSALDIARIFNSTITPALSAFMEVGKVVFQATRLAIFGVLEAAGDLGLGIETLLNKVGLISDEKLAKSVETAGLLKEQVQQAADGLAEAVGSFNLTSDAATNMDETIKGLSNTLQQLPSQISEPLANTTAQIKDHTDAWVKALQAARDGAATALLGGLKNVVSASLQAIGASLVQGTAAFSDFKKVILNIIGDMLIQVGIAMIPFGLLIDAIKAAFAGFSGAALIGIGALLVVLGGALKAAAAGSFAASVGGGGGGGGTSAGASEVDLGTQSGEPQKPKTEVVVNVQGNIFNGREQAQLIAENLQEYFDTNSGILAKG